MKLCDACYLPAVSDGIIPPIEGGTTNPFRTWVVDTCPMCGRVLEAKEGHEVAT